ncbi:MAG: VOC family protein [Myxococcota bacterium]
MNAIVCKGLDHVVLRVRNLERAIAFYEAVLGLEVERRLEDLGLVQLRAGNSLLDLVSIQGPLGRSGGEAPAENGPNMDHFALALVSFDEDAIRDHLAAHGVEAGPTGNRYGADGYGPSVYLKDLDGNTVELKGPPE